MKISHIEHLGIAVKSIEERNHDNRVCGTEVLHP